jgi:hypothetical protein
VIVLAQHNVLGAVPIYSLFVVICLWKIFVKTGQPGWVAIIPFYNIYILLKIAGESDWWFILMFIPIVNVITYFFVCSDIAERFGKGAGFGIGLFFLPFIFYLILAFGNAQYNPAPLVQ